MERTKLVFSRLSHEQLPKQIAYILLRVCVQRQFDYLLRIIPPSIIEPYAAQFDALVREAAVTVCGLSDVALGSSLQHELAMKQLYMPIVMGGARLQQTADLRHIAFFAAHIGALMDMPIQWAKISAQHQQSYSDMLKIITECIDNTRAQFIASPAGENEVAEASRAKHIEGLDRLLIPWAPDDTNMTIKLSSLLQFYANGERSVTANIICNFTDASRPTQLLLCISVTQVRH